MLRASEPIIDTDALSHHGEILSAGVCGTVPRDYGKMPVRVYGAVEMPVLSMDEIRARAQRQADSGQRLSDLYLSSGWPNLDQSSSNYCWQYGPAHALMMLRAKANEPHVRLDAHVPAVIHQKGRNVGSWGAQGLENLTLHGAPRVGLWPGRSFDPRHLTEEIRADALKQRISEAWFDAAAPIYDRNMSMQQVLTLLVCGIPVVGDFDFWSHCVCLLDAVVMPDGSMAVRILNSWLNWGERGLAVLKGRQAIPDNAVGVRAGTGG